MLYGYEKTDQRTDRHHVNKGETYYRYLVSWPSVKIAKYKIVTLEIILEGLRAR